MEMAGGSEFRTLEMAGAISSLPDYECVVLAERAISSKLWNSAAKNLEVHERVMEDSKLDPLYSLDHLLVINSDSKDFATREYWLGKSARHKCAVQLKRIPQMTFLFNFIVSPACQLPGLQRSVEDIRIITANSKFFHEIHGAGSISASAPLSPAATRKPH